MKELYISQFQNEAQTPIVDRSINACEIAQVVSLNNYGMFEKNDTPPDHAPPPLKVEDVTNALANGSIIHGAFSQFQLIGFSWLTPQEGQLTVNVLSVHPEFRDHGLGTAFLQKADTVALEMKLPRTTLAVDPWNGRGVNTYLRHGYKIVDLKEAYFGPDYPQSQRFIMVKELAKEKFPYTESIDFQVDASEDIKYALSLGFVGTRLLRSEYDSRKNMITFER